MSSVFVVNEVVSIVKTAYVKISGTTVNASSSPISRKLYLYNSKLPEVLVASTISSAINGSFSFTVPGNANDRWMIVGKFGTGENSVIIDNITGIPQ